MSMLLHHFLHLLRESVPLFLLGAAVGAALEVWLPRGWVERWVAQGKGSVVLAATAAVRAGSPAEVFTLAPLSEMESDPPRLAREYLAVLGISAVIAFGAPNTWEMTFCRVWSASALTASARACAAPTSY